MWTHGVICKYFYTITYPKIENCPHLDLNPRPSTSNRPAKTLSPPYTCLSFGKAQYYHIRTVIQFFIPSKIWWKIGLHQTSTPIRNHCDIIIANHPHIHSNRYAHINSNILSLIKSLIFSSSRNCNQNCTYESIHQNIYLM